ncbi:MAG TPA: hypothetical protein PJ991_00455 [Kiritimatiellia bacterium]|nr:hypothetical protein [Kiritimatiellia bacterium]
MTRSILLFALLIFHFQSVNAEDADVMRTVIYPITFGDPQALEEISRAIVGEDGHLTLDLKGNRLIVVTTSAKHRQLDEVFGTAETAVDNVRIQVEFIHHSVERDRGAGIKGHGDIVVGGGGTSGKIVLHPEIRDSRTETSGNVRQLLLVASGREGFLRVGESVPYIEWISEYSWRGGYTESRILWQEAGSFLVVTPTIMRDGKTIHIKITPEIRGLVDGNPLRVKYTALATEVFTADGQTIQLGGSGKNQEFYSRFLVGMNRSGSTSAIDIKLTPQVVKPAP